MLLLTKKKFPLSYGFGKICWQIMIQTLTHTFNKEPVTIIASNLEGKTVHGVSLATKTNSYLMENPPLVEDLGLKKWYAQNKAKVAEWLKNKAYENNIKFFIAPKKEEILDLQGAMAAFQNVKTCWVKVKVRLRVTRNPLYNILCANCQMIVDAGVDWNIELIFRMFHAFSNGRLLCRSFLMMKTQTSGAQ